MYYPDLPGIYLLVCLLAELHKKLQADLNKIFLGKARLAELTGGKILLVIRISIRMQNRIEEFFIIAFICLTVFMLRKLRCTSVS